MTQLIQVDSELSHGARECCQVAARAGLEAGGARIGR